MKFSGGGGSSSDYEREDTPEETSRFWAAVVLIGLAIIGFIILWIWS